MNQFHEKIVICRASPENKKRFYMLKNHLTLDSLAETTIEYLGYVFSDITLKKRSAIVRRAIKRVTPMAQARAFLYTGPVTVNGQTYESLIAPNRFNPNPYRQDGNSPPVNRYVALLRAANGNVTVVHMDYSDAQLAGLADALPGDIAKAMRKVGAGKLFFENYQSWGRDWAPEDALSLRLGTMLPVGRELYRTIRTELAAQKAFESFQSWERYFAEEIRGEVSTQRRKIWRLFYNEKLDADLLDFMGDIREDRAVIYNHLAARRMSARIADFRAGAVEVLTQAGQRPSRWPATAAQTFWAYVDQGKSVIDAVAVSFKISPAIARKILNARRIFVGDELAIPQEIASRFLASDYRSPGDARMFSHQPNLHWPENAGEWEDFMDLVKLGNYLSKGSNSQRTAALLMRLWKNKPKNRKDNERVNEHNYSGWSDFGAFIKMGRDAAYDRPIEWDDTLNSMVDKIVMPAWLRLSSGKEPSFSLKYDAVREIKKLFDIDQMQRASDYWHENTAQFPRRPRGPDWPTLTDEVTSPDGITFYPLRNSDALDAEAEAMHHCVNDYASKCSNGSSYIYSIRDRRNRRLSTLELVDVSQEEIFRVRINQNKRFSFVAGELVKNTPAPFEAVEAAKWFRDAINEGRLETRSALFMAMKNEPKIGNTEDKVEEIKIRAGFDCHDEDEAERVFKLYTRCFPTRVREQVRGVTDFLRITGIDALFAKEGLPIAPKRTSGTNPCRKPSWQSAANGGQAL